VSPYYEAGGVTLYLGDCDAVLPLLPATFDLVFTSPPYNLGTSAGGGFAKNERSKAGKWSGGLLAHGYDQDDDALPHVEYVAQQRRRLALCWDRLTDDGAIFFNHKPRVQNGVWLSPLELNPGLPVRQVVIWSRAGGINMAPTHYCPTHEWIVILAKPAWRLKSKGASGVGDVWYCPQEPRTPHPAPFPLRLPATAIETTGARRVLDPHAGWGTTLLAAKLAGAQAVGIEKSERYCEMAARRLDQGVLPLFEEAAG
jgi:site-specific DNA-methyltransferase (adenine-specific)